MFAEQSEFEEKQENSVNRHSDQQNSLLQQEVCAQSKFGHYANQIESDFSSEEKCGQNSLSQQQAGAQSKSRHYASQKESDFLSEEKCGQNSLLQQQVGAQNKSRHYAWNPLYWIAVGIIRFYRKYISPMKAPCCRFLPTCSEYALEAFHRHGFFKGLFLSVRRIFRCNPFGKGGFDPVPSDFHIFKKRK